MFSALEVFYENALYKFTFDIDIDIDNSCTTLASQKDIFYQLMLEPGTFGCLSLQSVISQTRIISRRAKACSTGCALACCENHNVVSVQQSTRC